MEMNRTKFIKILDSLSQHAFSVKIGEEEFNTYSPLFKKHLDKSIEIIKAHDEEWKKEQEAKPLLWVFIKELQRTTPGHYTFKIGGGENELTFKDTQLPFFAGSKLMEENVAVSSKIVKTKQGWYGNQAQYDYPEYECTIVIDDAGKYDNVKREATE